MVPSQKKSDGVIILNVSSTIPQVQPLSVGEALDQLTAAMATREAARNAAEWLVAALLGCPRLDVSQRLSDLLPLEQQRQLISWRERAAAHEPIQYILGETEFMGMPIKCDARALIPRPETEQLVEQVLADPLLGIISEPHLVDVGTGTGCIALALAQRLPTAQILAIDASADALTLAQENVERQSCAGQVTLQQGDLLDHVPSGMAHLIVANLPYISSSDCQQLPPEVREHEPLQALDGGMTGRERIERLVAQAIDALQAGGALYLEVGAGQAQDVASVLRDHQYQAVAMMEDYAGKDRFVKGYRP